MSRPPRQGAAVRRERGIVLLFGLVVMVALALAAVAIARSVDSGTTAMGAIAFKQDATSAAAAGTEHAIGWLKANVGGTFLDEDREGAGYYASSMDALDSTGNRTTAVQPLRLVKWDDKCASVSGAFATCNTLPAPAITVNRNRVQWVITRLCAGPGPAGGANTCAMPPLNVAPQVNDRGQVQTGGRFKSGATTPYFRIIVRVEGPRQTVSVTEQLVHF